MNDPYAPPNAALIEVDPAEVLLQRRRVRLPWQLFGLGLACVLGVMIAVQLDMQVMSLVLVPCAAVFFAMGSLAGVASIFKLGAAPALVKVGIAVGPTVTGGAFSLMGAGITLLSTMGFARGRQLRHHGRIMLPPIDTRPGWTGEALSPVAPEALRAGLAEAWRDNARTEHASVAAFARLTLEMMALGAPPQLIEDAQQDAKDELRHTHLCFSLARGLDGRDEGPGAFPAARLAPRGGRLRGVSFARLAVDSLIDGALNEGVSARIVGRLAKRCEDPAVRAVLTEIASDEGRHAAHGWACVAWCLNEEPVAVSAALLGALRALPTSFADTLPEGAHGGAWEPWGIPGQGLAEAEYQKTRDHVLRRTHALLAKGHHAAA